MHNRLFGVLYYILERGRVTAPELAEEFEVSVRTIYRDIDSLSAYGIPIYAIQGKGGGIEISDNFVFSRSLLTEDEQKRIVSSLQGFANIGEPYGDELITKLSALFKVKNTNWIEIDFNSWQNDKVYEKVFDDIKNAIIGKKIISFSYFSANEEETNREVKPVRLLFKGQNWYLYAFCMLRNEFRYFKLFRIKNLKVCKTEFEDDFENVILKKELEYQNTVRVKVKFDRKVAFRVYDELRDNIFEDEDGNLYAEIELPYDHNLYNYIFSFGDAAEVLEPKEIRDQLNKLINKMAKKYETF